MGLNNEIKTLLDYGQRFVLFKKPNSNFINLYAQNNDKNYTSGFVINNFLNTEKHYIYPEKTNTFSLLDYQKELVIPFNKIKNVSPPIIEKSKEEYISMVNAAIKKLDDDFTKVVLSRFINWNHKTFNELHHFIQLCLNNFNAFCYLIYIPDTLCWLGASPELLINYKDKTLSTVSLAGTKKKQDSWTKKEYEEQQMVTDYIQSLANKYQITISKEQIKTISGSKEIEHLKTMVTANDVDYETAKKFLVDLHPTPAVCGIPKEKALKIINELENYNRSFYSGYVGLKKDEELELYVNLRCASVFENNICVYVGGGITKNSNPEKEWEETELKSKTIIIDF